MSEVGGVLWALAVDDDPEMVREVETLLANPRLKLEFADTPNAFGRLLETQSFDLALIHLHAGSLALLEPLARQLRSTEPPIPLVTLVGPDDDSAVAAVDTGAAGCVRIDNPRALVRILGERVALMLEQRDQAAALNQTRDIQNRYNLLLETSSEAIAYLHEGLHIYANPSYLQLFGYQALEDLEGFSILDLLQSTAADSDLKQILKAINRGQLPDGAVPVQARTADGDPFNALAEFAPARYDGEACTQIMVREQRAPVGDADMAQELEKLRTHDLLTGLLNRQAFIAALTEEMHQRTGDAHVAVLLLALDEDDALRNELGTIGTDQLIRGAAERMVEVVDAGLLPARLSDHVLAARLWFEQRSEAEELATRLVERFSGAIFEVEGKSPSITASVGLAIGGSDLFSIDDLLHQAERALREAQRAGGNAYLRYRPPSGNGDGGEDRTWVERLRHALNNDDFRLVYMPITSMEDETLSLYEFENRLRLDGSDEIIVPEVFLDAAMNAGLGAELDRALIDNVAAWRAASTHPPDRMLLPLSWQTLEDARIVELLQTLVDEGALPGPSLVLAFRAAEIATRLRELQRFISRFGARGVQFALTEVQPDTRIGPLVRHLDLAFIKLGGKLGPALKGDEAGRRQLEALVTEAAAQSIQVIAPPVEATTDLATLWQIGITLVQGDFIRDDG
ncbi:MAG: EAL domain-containing protein [Wenzhouxiangellaceae bacterium]|nr:EAL domain-containing protein [Wenzhouxiangellaceae bacterium]